MAKTNLVASQIFDFFIKAGFTPEQACGVVANAEAESGFNYKATGDGGLANGLFQWHPDRCEAMRKGTGIDVMSMPPVDEQLQALLWELKHRETGALKHLQASDTAFNAGYNFCRYFERPASESEWTKRGYLAKKWMTYFTFKRKPAAPALPAEQGDGKGEQGNAVRPSTGEAGQEASTSQPKDTKTS